MGVASRILNLHPRTLRIYENEGLIKPFRSGGKRIFSQTDLVWIECLRTLIHDENLSIQGIKKLLDYAPCWKLKNCPEEIMSKCCAFKQNKRDCWDYAKNVCKKSCKNCEIYLKEKCINQ